MGWLELELSLFTNPIKNKWFKLQVSYQYWISVRKGPERQVLGLARARAIYPSSPTQSRTSGSSSRWADSIGFLYGLNLNNKFLSGWSWSCPSSPTPSRTNGSSSRWVKVPGLIGGGAVPLHQPHQEQVFKLQVSYQYWILVWINPEPQVPGLVGAGAVPLH